MGTKLRLIALLATFPLFVMCANSGATTLFAIIFELAMWTDSGTITLLAIIFLLAMWTNSGATTLLAIVFVLTMGTLGFFTTATLNAKSFVLAMCTNSSATTLLAIVFLLVMGTFFFGILFGDGFNLDLLLCRRIIGNTGWDDGPRVVILEICQLSICVFPRNHGVVGFYVRIVCVKHSFKQQIACMLVQLRIV